MLEKSNRLLRLLQDSNVTLRWLILHVLSEGKIGLSSKNVQKLRDLIVANQISSENILELILNSAELELQIKETLGQLLENKTVELERLQKECISSLEELSEVYSGKKPLTKLEKNENLAAWFMKVSKELKQISLEDVSGTSRKLTQVIRAVEEVQGKLMSYKLIIYISVIELFFCYRAGQWCFLPTFSKAYVCEW